MRLKNKLLLLTVVFFLSHCTLDIKTNSVTAEQTNVACAEFSCVAYKNFVKEGMIYGIFYNSRGGTGEGMQMFIVNHTKDKLEVELLRKQLAK